MKPRAAIALGAIAVSLLALGTQAHGSRADAATALGSGVVTVAPSQFGDLRSGQPLHLALTIDEQNGAGVAGGTATVLVDRDPLTTSDELQDWLSGSSNSSTAATPVATAATDGVPTGGVRTVQITAPAASLKLRSSGVYAVAVSLTASGSTTTTTARTAVVWKTTGTQSVPLALAAPLTVPAGTGGFITSADLATYTAPTGILTRELDDLEGTQVAIGIDPRILASIRVLGKTAPQSARDWLVRLTNASNQTFPLAWADSDLTAPLQAGEATIPTVKPLDYAIVPSRFAPVDANNTPSPTATADPDNPTLPTSQSLVKFGYTLPDLSWPAENSVASTDLAKLQDSGVTAAILDSTNVKRPTARQPQGSSARIGDLDVQVSDSTISQYLRDAAAAPTHQAWNADMARLTTSIAVLNLQSSGSSRTMLATFGRNWQDTDTYFDDTLTGMFTRPWISPANVTDVAGAQVQGVSIKSMPESSARVARVKEMLAAEARVDDFSVVASPQAAVTSGQRLSLLSLLSDEWLANPTGWDAASLKYLQKAKSTTSSVQVVRSSNVLLLSDQISLPITVSNALDQSVTVYVAVRPRTTLISVDQAHRMEEVTLNARSQRRIEIPIQSLSNGKAEVRVSLYSASGQQVGSTTSIKINVQAGWETVGTLAFGALVVGIFAFGLIRNIRKRRRPAAAETDDADDDGRDGAIAEDDVGAEG